VRVRVQAAQNSSATGCADAEYGVCNTELCPISPPQPTAQVEAEFNLHGETTQSFDYTKQTAFIAAFAATIRSPTDRVSLEILFARSVVFDWSSLSAGSKVISADVSLGGFTMESFDEVAQHSTKAALATQLKVEIENIYITGVSEVFKRRRRRLQETEGTLDSTISKEPDPTISEEPDPTISEELHPAISKEGMTDPTISEEPGSTIAEEGTDPIISVKFDIVLDSSSSHLLQDVQGEIEELATDPTAMKMVAIDLQNNMIELGALPPDTISMAVVEDSIKVVTTPGGGTESEPTDEEDTGIVAEVTTTFLSESDAAETVHFLKEDDAQKQLEEELTDAGMSAKIEESSLQTVIVTPSPTASPVVTSTATYTVEGQVTLSGLSVNATSFAVEVFQKNLDNYLATELTMDAIAVTIVSTLVTDVRRRRRLSESGELAGSLSIMYEVRKIHAVDVDQAVNSITVLSTGGSALTSFVATLKQGIAGAGHSSPASLSAVFAVPTQSEDPSVSFQPVINIIGSDQMIVDASQRANYSDQGAVCSDAQHGDLSQNLVTTGHVSTSMTGVYVLQYDCQSGDGSSAIPASRTVTVIDSICPSCSLKDGDMHTTLEASFPFVEPGYKCQGYFPSRQLSSTDVAIEGVVDVEAVGTYVLTYRVKGTQNEECVNPQSLYRTVVVEDTLLPVISLHTSMGGKLVSSLEDKKNLPHTSLIAVRSSTSDATVVLLAGSVVGGVLLVLIAAGGRRIRR
jgi:hypothetical protein